MLSVDKLTKIVVATAFTMIAPLAIASNDCVKPKVKGFSADNMTCIGEGLIEVNDYNDAMVVNSTGKTIVPQGKYMKVFDFSEGLAGVIDKNYKAGFIDKLGKVVVPLAYEPAMEGEGGSVLKVNPFKEGVAAVGIDKSDEGSGDANWGFIDKAAKTIIPFKYAAAGNFGNDIAPVAMIKNDDYQYVWGYINKSGKTVIPFTFDYAGSFSDNVAVVVKSDKYGVIDTQGKTVLPFKYEYMNSFSDGLAAVFQKGKPIKNSDSVRGKFGFIDKTGKVVIPIQYDIEYYGDLNLPDFKNGKAALKDSKGNAYCINKQAKKVSC